jgi:hypothetical protein
MKGLIERGIKALDGCFRFINGKNEVVFSSEKYIDIDLRLDIDILYSSNDFKRLDFIKDLYVLLDDSAFDVFVLDSYAKKIFDRYIKDCEDDICRNESKLSDDLKKRDYIKYNELRYKLLKRLSTIRFWQSRFDISDAIDTKKHELNIQNNSSGNNSINTFIDSDIIGEFFANSDTSEKDSYIYCHEFNSYLATIGTRPTSFEDIIKKENEYAKKYYEKYYSTSDAWDKYKLDYILPLARKADKSNKELKEYILSTIKTDIDKRCKDTSSLDSYLLKDVHSDIKEYIESKKVALIKIKELKNQISDLIENKNLYKAKVLIEASEYKIDNNIDSILNNYNDILSNATTYQEYERAIEMVVDDIEIENKKTKIISNIKDMISSKLNDDHYSNIEILDSELNKKSFDKIEEYIKDLIATNAKAYAKKRVDELSSHEYYQKQKELKELKSYLHRHNVIDDIVNSELKGTEEILQSIEAKKDEIESLIKSKRLYSAKEKKDSYSHKSYINIDIDRLIKEYNSNLINASEYEEYLSIKESVADDSDIESKDSVFVDSLLDRIKSNMRHDSRTNIIYIKKELSKRQPSIVSEYLEEQKSKDSKVFAKELEIKADEDVGLFDKYDRVKSYKNMLSDLDIESQKIDTLYTDIENRVNIIESTASEIRARVDSSKLESALSRYEDELAEYKDRYKALYDELSGNIEKYNAQKSRYHNLHSDYDRYKAIKELQKINIEDKSIQKDRENIISKTKKSLHNTKLNIDGKMTTLIKKDRVELRRSNGDISFNYGGVSSKHTLSIGYESDNIVVAIIQDRTYSSKVSPHFVNKESIDSKLKSNQIELLNGYYYINKDLGDDISKDVKYKFAKELTMVIGWSLKLDIKIKDSLCYLSFSIFNDDLEYKQFMIDNIFSRHNRDYWQELSDQELPREYLLYRNEEELREYGVKVVDGLCFMG